MSKSGQIFSVTFLYFMLIQKTISFTFDSLVVYLHLIYSSCIIMYIISDEKTKSIRQNPQCSLCVCFLGRIFVFQMLSSS